MSYHDRQAAMERHNLSKDRRYQAQFMSDAYKVVHQNSDQTTIEVRESILEDLIDGEHVSEEHDGCFTMATEQTNHICDCCQGSGKCVDPRIDAGALTVEDFREDPDFAKQYHSGWYDITCPECHGNKIVTHLHWEAPKWLDEAIARFNQYEYDYMQTCMAEFRFGC